MSRKTILLFDIDGTLIESAGAGGGALLESLSRQFGVQNPQRVPLHGRTDRGILDELLEANGLEPNPENRARFRGAYFDCLPDILAARSGRVLPGVRELLDGLSEIPGAVKSLLTGNMERSAWMKLRHFALAQHFSGGIFGDEHACRKALGGQALAMLERQGHRSISASEVVVIGDTTLDVECAKAIGCRVLAVCTGGCSRDQLVEHGADHVVDDLTDTDHLIAWLLNPA